MRIVTVGNLKEEDIPCKLFALLQALVFSQVRR